MNVLIGMQEMLDRLKVLDFLAPLMMRLYLAPVFWFAGYNKFQGFSGVVAWFDRGLGLPLPEVMAFLATATELLGAAMLLAGFGVRWVSVPLMITMLVAIFAVHWNNGWQAVLDPQSPWAPEYAADGIARLSRGKDILREHGNYDWLTEYGSYVVSNNGIEWGATYFIMLLALFFMGSGAISIDALVRRIFMR